MSGLRTAARRCAPGCRTATSMSWAWRTNIVNVDVRRGLSTLVGMTLALRSKSFALTCVLSLTACATEGEAPTSGAPEVDPPPADPWIADVYEPVQEEAKQMSVAEFLAEYPQPNYVQALGYEPGDAAFLPEIAEYAGLTPEHEALLASNGFVAVGDAPGYTFATTYLDLYFNDLPVFVSADSLLYALHRSFDSMLVDFEYQVLVAEVGRMLDTMHGQLAAEQKSLPAALAPAARDLDIYLTVARTLLSDTPAEPVGDVAADVQRILDAVAAEQPSDLALFGQTTLYDYSQMKPRGHYTDDPVLQRYWRAMIWLGRTDMAMVTYDQQQQPQFNRRGLEAAFLSNHLLAASGADASWTRVDNVLVRLIGERDGMNPTDMTAFMKETGVDTPDALAAAGDEQLYAALLASPYGIQRIMSQIMYTDPNAPKIVLPRVYLLLGQRFTLDSYVFNNVTYDRVQNLETGAKVKRMLPSELDVQFVLGSNAAGHRLQPELDQWGYQGVLHELRFLADAHPADFWDATFYNGWLAAIRALNDDAEFEARPAAMRTAAWADKTLNTQAASWSELRHDTLLYVKQSYSGSDGCEYPDAYVEPVPGFYARLGHLGELGSELAGELEQDGFQVVRAKQFFADLTGVAGTLEGIAHKELEGEELSQAEFEFLRGTIEEEQVGCGETQFDGWYAKLFYDPAKIAEFDPTIADVHTAPTDQYGNEKGWVLHAATGRPMLMVFTMQDCGGVKSYIGPISSYHSVLTEQFQRQTDEQWAETLFGEKPAPRPAWTESFVR
jgi:hypothetical protein